MLDGKVVPLGTVSGKEKSVVEATSTMYKKIVVAYDGSEFSKSALRESAQWIKRHGGQITLVHAVYFDEEEFGNAPEQIEKRFAVGKRMCLQSKEDISAEFGIKVESIVCQGDPPKVIDDIAWEKKADLVAIGTHGRKGLKRLIMGSVTAHVILNAPCDVLVVKKPCTACTGTYESILVPYDGSEFSKLALNRACRIAKIDGADVTVLYVIPRYEEMIGFVKTEGIKNSLHQEAQRIVNSAAVIASAQDITLKTVIEEGSASDKIVEIASLFKNDLIVMGSYGWKGVSKAIMGSTTERVIMNATCPILIVR
ncbi:MAG: universal stress protein [Nitrospirota bacterium]